jgi:hypothetical protein
MFRTDFMPRSHDTALEKRKGTFYGVRVNVPHNVDPATMVDRLVSCSRDIGPFNGERIGCEVIGHNYVNIFADMLSDEIGQGSRFNVFGFEHSQFTIALPDANYDLFGSVSASVSLPSRSPSADVSFIYLDNAVEFAFISLQHGRSDAMTEVPRRFIAHADSSLNLASRHSLLSLAQEKSSQEPLPQRQMGIMEDRSRGCAKLVVAAITVKLSAVRNWCGFRLAAWALRTIGPTQLFYNQAALFIRTKFLAQFGEV